MFVGVISIMFFWVGVNRVPVESVVPDISKRKRDAEAWF